MSVRFDIMPACKTCSWWKQFPEAPHLGVCQKMFVSDFGERIAISVQNDDSTNDGVDQKTVQVRETFGCRAHSDFVLMRYRTY